MTRLAARLARCLILLSAFLGLVAPAQADDISAAARGVVRVVTIAVVDGQVVGFGHGSGFAVSANRIVTNAHVVDLARRYPDNVVLGVVPSQGNRSFSAHVVALDPARDLALLEVEDATLAPLTLYSGPVDDGAQVVALGYPGNVDVATARSAADFITPMSPIRSEGVFSGRRDLSGTQVLLHTAGIARGNSGGPLLDACGRVIGVNSALTRGDEGDASFGFAIADSELAGFLRDAGQAYSAVGSPCTSMAALMQQDSEADARATAEAEAQRREAALRTQMEREQRLVADRAQAERSRENVIAIAAVLLVLAGLSAGASGLLASRGRREAAWWTGGAAAALFVAAVAVFVTRPTAEVAAVDLDTAPATPAAKNGATGRLTCRFVPGRSRVTVSSTDDVALDWTAGGCMNARTQYAGSGDRWQRILVPAHEPTVSVLSFRPGDGTYSVDRYLLDDTTMQAMRKLRDGDDAAKSCTADPAALRDLAAAQDTIRSALPALPNERLVYRCSPAGAG